MKKILFWIFPLIPVFILGCAYFNTFYNTRMYYNRAYTLTEKNKTTTITGEEQTNYQYAVGKALLLLENYPTSKWADDALLLLGKSYYYLKDYPASERRLNELITGYPQSELLNEAKFWMAKTKVATARFQEAENDLNALISRKISKKQTGEIYFYQAKFYEERKDFQKAVETYQSAIRVDAKTWGARAWFAIGDDYDSLGVFDRSLAAFQQVLKYNPDPETAFDAQFRVARSQKELRRFDEAVRMLEKLAADEKNKIHVPVLRLEVGDCLDRKGDVAGAVLTYQDIIQSHPNTEYSAEASYRLGGIYEKERKDYDRALDSYSQVKKQSARSVYADSAEIKGRDILRLKALKQVVGMALRGEKGEAVEVGSIAVEDTLNKAPQDTSLNVNPQNPDQNQNQNPDADQEQNRSGDFRAQPSNFADSTKTQNRSASKIAENPELKTFNKEEIDKNLFLLAELYLFRFQIPDSALSRYRLVTQQFPQSPYAPQALYNMGYTYEFTLRDSVRADSCYRQLAALYPDSPHARGVAKRLHIGYAVSKEDSAWAAFQDAERTFLEEKDFPKAVKQYASVWMRFPKSQTAPKALYSTGWVYENALDAPDQAFAMYDSLISRYPNSPFAEKVKAKVEAVKTEKSRKVQLEQKAEEAKSEIKLPVKTEETSVPAVSDSTRTPAKPDTTKRMGGDVIPPEAERLAAPSDTTTGL